MRVDYNDPENASNYRESKSFEEKYVKSVKERTYNGPIELKSPDEDETLKEMKNEYAKKKTQEVESGNKYQCELCKKMFKGPEFVYKHIFNKHIPTLEDKFNKKQFE